MIEVQHVTRMFGTFRAVDDVSFSIQKGEIIGLLGPNGAGKTTTMRMITGFLEPTSGSVKIDGIEMNSDAVEAKRKIGYMPESAQLYGDMIVEDYLRYVARMLNVDPDKRVPELAKICGLTQQMDKNINELSRGNKQRVGLAHALMGEPEILILDEPTSGLDPNQVIEVRDLVKEIGRTRTVIVSTHILSEVEAICNRVIIISDGKVVADDSTENLRETFGKKAVINIQVGGSSAESVTSVLSAVPGVSSDNVKITDAQETSFNGQKLVCASISVSTDNELRPAIVKAIANAGMELYEITVRKNSLEDVFRTLTTGGEEK